MATKTTQVLTTEIFATAIHGTTGVELYEGYLLPGTLIQNITDYDHYGLAEPGDVRFEFLASADGGKTWFRQQSYSRPQTSEQGAD